jgi:hypothetical protein
LPGAGHRAPEGPGLKAEEGYRNHETAARIDHDAKRLPEALAHLQKAIERSRGKAPKEYTENLEKELAVWKAQN